MSRGDVALSDKAVRGLADFLAEIVERAAVPVVVEAVRRALADRATPTHATSANNPIGSPGAFRAAVAKGKFRTWKQGRRYIALWAEVEQSMRSKPVEAQEKRMQEQDDEARLRSAAQRKRGRRG